MSHPTTCPECSAPMRKEWQGSLYTGWHCSTPWVHEMQAERDHLKAKLAESEARVRELEAKLEVYERDLCCECEGRVELRWVCADCNAQSEESPSEEARKKGAEHGE